MEESDSSAVSLSSCSGIVDAVFADFSSGAVVVVSGNWVSARGVRAGDSVSLNGSGGREGD
jgi:hypothetical protein